MPAQAAGDLPDHDAVHIGRRMQRSRQLQAEIFVLSLPAADFEISDADYEEFKQRVLASGFTYDPETEKYLSQLVKLAKFEGYYDDAKEEFDRLEKKLTHNLSKDLDYNKDQLKKILASDIVAAYYYQRGAIANSLRDDKQMEKACQLIHDTEEYQKILRP